MLRLYNRGNPWFPLTPFLILVWDYKGLRRGTLFPTGAFARKTFFGGLNLTKFPDLAVASIPTHY